MRFIIFLIGLIAVFTPIRAALPSNLNLAVVHCGNISTDKHDGIWLEDTGKEKCEALRYFGRPVQPESFFIGEGCSCSFFYNSEMAPPCNQNYVVFTKEGPDFGSFEGKRAAWYCCWST